MQLFTSDTLKGGAKKPELVKVHVTADLVLTKKGKGRFSEAWT